MKKFYLSLFATLITFLTIAQTGTEFWLAPPNVTDDHHDVGNEINEIYLSITCLDQDADVTISQPAGGGFATRTINMTANTSIREYLGDDIAVLETKPTNTILQTGLLIEATNTISVYYEYDNENNPDIYALKGANSLGYEFYIPLQNYSGTYRNHSFVDKAYASFDIVATEDGTTVRIYPSKDVDGYPAQAQFTIPLDRGETYSCGWTGANYEDPATHPHGSVVVSDKPIAVSIKDDSEHNYFSGGCYDLMGDQLVPVDIVGNEYIVIKGELDQNENIFMLATENNTEVYINGGATPIAVLFAGETYRYDISGAGQDLTYIEATAPMYVTHVTGFGCEMGQALLPPLNCAGSEEISFVRSTDEGFFLSLLIKSGSEGDFTIFPATTTINPADFNVVPGTSNEWVAARIQFNTSEIPVGTAYRISNSTNIFAMGLINGGNSTGCRYGYFSEFVSEIVVDAGTNQTICANKTAPLSGSVSGGTTSGIWTTSGSGTFTPSDTDLNAEYNPSAADITTGSVQLTLTSKSVCFPEQDVMDITITPAPSVDAGGIISACTNNPDITLNGTITNASGGGYWSGGLGTYIPDNNTLNAVYIPTPAEISSGSLTLTLTSVDADCDPVTDNLSITFGPSPTASAGIDQTICANNADVTLNGSVTVATGGIWSGGAGTFNPSTTALNAVYTPTAGEISGGSITLTLTTTGNGGCNSVSDDIVIDFTLAPTSNAGTDQTLCENNADISLGGAVTTATEGQWTGGLGTFTPNNTTLNATYTPTVGEIASGNIALTLTTTGNGTCIAVTDDIDVNFTGGPTIDAGTDETVCGNDANVSLAGSFTVSTGAIWSNGGGTFTPNNTDINATYTPSALEITNGSTNLILTTTGNGTCNSVSDDIDIIITPTPTANAGLNQTICSNNPDVTLSGIVTVATGGQWSGGTGTYNPSNTALNAIYTPTAGEIAFGSVTLILTTTGNGTCNSVNDNMTISFTQAPTSNAGTDQTICANNSDIILNGSVTIATGGQWSGGLGTYAPDNSSLNTIYSPNAGEIASGNVTLTLTTTGNGNCNAATDEIDITFTTGPTVNAGSNQVVCANNSDVTLNGSVTISSGGIWSGGNGVFTPSNTDLNAVYTPSATEIITGTVNLTLTTTGNGNCSPEVDDMIITITPAPIVNAGLDLNSCANNSSVNLNGSVSNAGGGIWSGGTGTFSPNNTVLNATYTPSATEITDGSVTLTLTSSGNGSCIAVSDDVDIIIASSPIVDAGTPQTVCGNNADVVLNGYIENATGGIWSGGLGVFTPNNSVLNAVYTPNATEVSNGFVNLTLTSTGNGDCNAEVDNVTITYTISPQVDAGLDQTVCANNPDVTLNGSFTVATGAMWSGGLGTYSPDNTTIDAIYTPIASEIAAGSITLTLTTTGNGDCNAVSDDIEISITPSPSVFAGPDETICVDDLNVPLNGFVAGITTTGQWSTTGTGTFIPNNTTLNATYTISAADSTFGSVTLTLTSTNNDICLAQQDNLDITILPAGVSNAGIDQTVCGNNANVSLNGSVSGGASAGEWSTSGSGTFVPTSTTLNAVYIPSQIDTTIGSVTLTLTANSCNSAENNVEITITPAPYVNAGDDITVCVDNLNVQLDATINGGTTTGIWSTTGSGTFSPDNTTIDAIYNASAADSASSGVDLILTSTNNGDCIAVIDTVHINIFPAGIVDAGFDQTLCSNNANIDLNGSITGGASEGIWATSGSGSFIPDDTSLNATYIPSSADTATGSVTLALTATNSCNFALDLLNINFTPAPTTNAGADVSVCENDANVGLTGSYTISGGAVWSSSGTGSFLPSAADMNAIYIPSNYDISTGNVIIKLTTTNNSGCSPVSDSLEVEITSEPNVNAGSNQNVCSSSNNTNLVGIISGGSSTGQWSTLGSGTFSDNTDLNATYTYSLADVTAGSVQIVLASTNNGNCLEVKDTMLISFGNTVNAYAGGDITVCASDLNVPLNGFVSGGSSTGTWSSSGTGVFIPDEDNLNASYLFSSADSTYGEVELILTTTNNGGCLAGKDTMNILADYVPTVNAGEDIIACLGTDAITLAATSENTPSIEWITLGSGTFVPDNTSLNCYYLPSTADSIIGSVQLNIQSTNENSCSQVTDDILITFNTPLVPDFTYSTACEDMSIDFSDNTTILNGTITNWTWNFNDGSPVNSETTSYTFNSTGIYDVNLTVASSLGCSYSITKPVTVNPIPVVDFYSTIECYRDTVYFTDQSAIASGSNSSWNWEFGDDSTSTVQNSYHIYEITGIYDVTLTAISAAGCSSSATNSIELFDAPVADYSYTYNCYNTSVNFANTSTSEGININFWNWNFGNGNTSDEENPTYNYPNLGEYPVQLIVGYSNNCSDTISRNILINSIEADFSYKQECASDSVPFIDITDYDGSSGNTWKWLFGDGQVSTSENPSHLYDTGNDYTVSFIATSLEGCVDTTIKTVSVHPIPSSGFSMDADDFAIEETISFIDESSDATEWEWYFGDLGTSTNQNPEHIYQESDIYSITQIVISEYGCVDTAIVDLEIKNLDKVYAPKAPNAFTPNGDNNNDIFYVRGGPFKSLTFKVYNSWGQLVFETNDADTGWDGTKDGVEQPIGVYVYTIIAVTIDDASYKKSGDVTLIR